MPDVLFNLLSSLWLTSIINLFLFIDNTLGRVEMSRAIRLNKKNIPIKDYYNNYINTEKGSLYCIMIVLFNL